MRIKTLLVSLFLGLSVQARSADQISWMDWNDEAFQRAEKEHKLVLLDLKAVWCHWCHVMDEKTYSNPEIIKIINEHFIAIDVDQDSRPDLTARYDEYGWPATIILNEKAQDLKKLSGYIPPEQMKATLLKVIKNPVVEPDEVLIDISNQSPYLSKESIEKLVKDNESAYDHKYKGWGWSHKYLQAWPVEWSLREGAKGNDKDLKEAQETLDAALVLIDPVWGGAYQYSANDGKWNEPHFEKIMSFQADNLRVYSLAASYFNNQKYLEAAQKIKNYLFHFLQSPEGAFYTSQDADLIQGQHSSAYFRLSDQKRRAKGIPRIDQHIYSRENGWAEQALLVGYEMTGDETMLREAERSVAWILAHRSIAGGGFSHDQKDEAGPYLGDSLAMSAAFLEFYKVTQDASWITKAKSTAQFIEKNFTTSSGFASSSVLNHGLIKPRSLHDENISLILTMNLLYQYTGDELYKSLSEQAMKFIASPTVLAEDSAASALLADSEMKTAPLHLAVVGSRGNPAAQKLYTAALKYPTLYKRIEWVDPSKDERVRKDVQYPKMSEAAIFICTGSRCSLPIFNAQSLADQIKKISK